MLSILIPVHNFDCANLVSDLHHQCLLTGKDFEILVLDDISTRYLEENRQINEFSYCRYIESKTAYGRAKVRNTLSEKAQYEYLLFIDSDAIIDSTDFIQNYLNNIGKAEVIVGGLKYKPQPPKYNRLRWTYGTKREVKSAAIRNASPYKSISSFNLLVQRDTFLTHCFNEEAIDLKESSYGHEDTLLGLSFKSASIKVLHIDNPLIHDSQETDLVFLENSLIAVDKYVYNQLFRQAEVVSQIKIFRVFEKFKALNLIGLLCFIYAGFGKYIKRNLLSTNPSLWLFDLYRLSHLANTYKEFKAYNAKLPNQ